MIHWLELFSITWGTIGSDASGTERIKQAADHKGSTSKRQGEVNVADQFASLGFFSAQNSAHGIMPSFSP